MQDPLQSGLSRFNAARFFDAHELWEEVWHATSGPERAWMQGLVQVAVAMHHYSTGNRDGAVSLLKKARGNLADCRPNFHDLDVSRLQDDIQHTLERLAAKKKISGFKILSRHQAT